MTSSPASGRAGASRWARFARRALFPDWLFNRKVETNRTGYFFLFLIVAVSVAAFNTGNNMLYLVLAMMLGALFSSFLISEYMIAELRVKRSAPEYVTEGVSFRVEYAVENEKELIPSLAVRVTEHIGDFEVSALVAFVGGGSEIKVKGHAIVSRRGRLEVHNMTISTTAPFGWFRKSKRAPISGELVALPRTDPGEVDRDIIAALGEQRPVYKRGRGDQLFGFRKYNRGDPVKKIHWKTSARIGRPMVRESEAEEERRLRIELALPGPMPEERDEVRETTVRKAASVCEAAISDGWWSWPITIFWIVGITNAVNLIDGLDGLAAGISAIACGVIALFAFHAGQPVMVVLMLALLGSLSGFLFFNFNPAKIFMGDCGSMFLGFILGASSVL